ncbi:hypothetical protein [Moritella viscosa]|uniref:Lipoprotein n=1 Tax=Moritella viscosa TaxID=80854 RepID=A0A1L0BBP4_9GAMM|nr:hypothetical protein [Moritella viscosa]SGY94805.1 Lipoprotein [Moritella viscosa]
MDFTKFNNLDNIYVWDEETQILEKLVDNLKWETLKDEDESQEDYEKRADYFVKYDDVFESEESFLKFCIAEGEELGSILSYADVYEINEENLYKSEFSKKGTSSSLPLCLWFEEQAIRFFQIPVIKETYGEPKKYYSDYQAALEFYRLEKLSKEQHLYEDPFVDAMVAALEPKIPDSIYGLFEDGELDSLIGELNDRTLAEEDQK